MACLHWRTQQIQVSGDSNLEMGKTGVSTVPDPNILGFT